MIYEECQFPQGPYWILAQLIEVIEKLCQVYSTWDIHKKNIE